MNIEILERLQKEDLVQNCIDPHKSIGSLSLMEEALMLTATFLKTKKTMVVVKKNQYEASQLYRRISLMLEDVLLFVMEESLRVQAIASSPEDKNEMIYTLTQIVERKKPFLLICSTASFTRYLPDPDFFKSNCMDLKIDQEMDLHTLKEKLVRIGYTRLNYVDRPCTFAARGGIIDIFSLEYEHPVRIEFFDTQIESIRFFDETTQRTIQRVSEIHISPATDLLFCDEQILEIKENVLISLKKEKSRLKDVQDQIFLFSLYKDLFFDGLFGRNHLF